MLNQILRFTLLSSLLLWLKPRWRGLLALIVFVVMVHVLHGEYLDFVELSGEQSFLVWSFILKWAVLITGVCAYCIFALRNGGALRKPREEGRESAVEAAITSGRTDDGFDFIRKKKTLEGPAEQILKKREFK